MHGFILEGGGAHPLPAGICKVKKTHSKHMYMKSTQFMPPHPLTGEGVYRSVRYMHNKILFSHPVVFLKTSFLNYCLLKGGKVCPPPQKNNNTAQAL